MSQRQLAQAVGISIGGVHYVIKALVDKGFIKLLNPAAAEDKRRNSYFLMPKCFQEKIRLTRRFILPKMDEYEAINAELTDMFGELTKRDLGAIKSELCAWRGCEINAGA